MKREEKSLTQTFVPKSLIRRTSMKNTNPLLQKNKFQKTHGNSYVEIDPPQIKFNGYQLNKANQLSFKIINKAPIPQRFNIIGPTQQQFSIKVNKKGSIPSGMHQIVYVYFKPTEFKYLYDVVKINTQTENFVVPLYAYPTIPNLNTLFPKVIDFGNIEVKQTESYLYPIVNPTPIDFSFEFSYSKQCSQIMINPLKGVIPGNNQLVIQIAFIPSKKMTYSAEVSFRLQQFDFESIFIKIIGTGKDKQLGKTSPNTMKRLKSSKLVPIKDKQQGDQSLSVIERMNQTQAFVNVKIKQLKKQSTFRPNIRKSSNTKSGYPKLLNSTMKGKSVFQQQNQASNILQNQKSSSVIKNSEQRQFMSRFNKVQQMDKQKEIKFYQYLGDKAMNQSQLQYQRNIVKQMNDFRSGLLKNQCQSRNNPQKSQSVEVQYKKFTKNPTLNTWDEKKNDALYERRVILNRFVMGASKVIQVRRMQKRLQKIRQFLGDCSTKEQVIKKVQQSYQKSLNEQDQYAFKGEINLEFNRSNISPCYFPLQFSSGDDKLAAKLFQPKGQPNFDDFNELPLIQEKENQKLGYNQVDYPNGFVPLTILIPPLRVSGEQQFSVKSSSLPNIQPIQLFDLAGKPLDIPNHYFIQAQNIVKFKNYNPIDQKDLLYILSEDQPIQDQFQGWSKGDHEILKAKLLKNSGINYTTFSSYNYSGTRNDIGFLGNLCLNLPEFIDHPQLDDQLQANDSDEQKYQEPQIEYIDQFLQKIETQPDLKQKRTKGVIQNQDQLKRDKIEKNLQKDQLNQSSLYVGKIKEFNKWLQKQQNKLIF